MRGPDSRVTAEGRRESWPGVSVTMRASASNLCNP